MKQKQIIVALGLLMNDNKQILVSLRNDPKHQSTHNKWEIPGGAVEFGETIKQAAQREMMEEIGVDVSFPDFPPIVRTHVWKHPNIHVQVILIGHICKTQDTPHPANEEVSDVRWVGPDEIDRLDYLPECDVFIKKASEYISSK